MGHEDRDLKPNSPLASNCTKVETPEGESQKTVCLGTYRRDGQEVRGNKPDTISQYDKESEIPEAPESLNLVEWNAFLNQHHRNVITDGVENLPIGANQTTVKLA